MPTFPSVKPTSRTYKPGRHPVTVYRNRNGSVSTRLHGNKPAGGTLGLGFSNVLDSVADAILSFYLSVYSEANTFDLPPEIVAGAGTELAGKMRQLTGASRWRFADEPGVQNAATPGRSTVSVSLVEDLVSQ